MSLPTYHITSGPHAYQGEDESASEPVHTPAWRWHQPATRSRLKWGAEPQRIVSNRNLTSHMQRILDRPDQWPSDTITIRRITP